MQTAACWSSLACIALERPLQLVPTSLGRQYRRLSFQRDACAERLGRIDQPLEDIARLLAADWGWESSRGDERTGEFRKAIRVTIFGVDQAMPHLIQRNRLER